jgi:hypothetical protein
MPDFDLSRRKLVTTAATLPALAVPAVAAAAPASTGVSATACTLPARLAERVLHLRAWYLDYRKRCEQASDEADRRFEAATGVTHYEWAHITREDSRRDELRSVLSKIYDDFPILQDDEPEGDQLWQDRWDLAEEIMHYEPQTIVDLAYQAEAYLIADLELVSTSAPYGTCDGLLRKFFQHIRALGALPPPDDPMGVLSIDVEDEEEA